ncbi:MAG: hypothetical protein AAB215_06135 [Planctomycetota bacterium]
MPPSIAVVSHENARRLRRQPYLLGDLARIWRDRGHEVLFLEGTSRFVPADVAISHVDLTVVPEDYRAFLGRFPRALNAGAADLSKRKVSRNLVSPGDGWDGPVVVKSDRNSGGLPDAELLEGGLRYRAPLRWIAGARARWFPPGLPLDESSIRAIRTLRSTAYTVFPKTGDVPPAVFENPALVVERFLPERDGGRYVVRCLFVLGDACFTYRVLSDHPIVKSPHIRVREEIPVDSGAQASARALGLDYGKLDYVVLDGRIVVLDANRTPAIGHPTPHSFRARLAETLAPGIGGFLGS